MRSLKKELQSLHKLTQSWRAQGRKARLAAVGMSGRLAQGHMHGVGDGLDLAADDIDTLIDKLEPLVDAAKTQTHVTHDPA